MRFAASESNSLLPDKVVLVTGSTTGIGAAIARLATAEGAHVMVHGRNEDRARRLVAELGKRASFVVADLEQSESWNTIIDATVNHFGRINGLVNNAAWSARSNISTTDVRLFNRVIATNLLAPLMLIRSAIPHFRKQGGGSVVNIGSVNSYCGEANLLAYSISKGGLMTLSRNLADAHATENIRVNHLNVGWVGTENEIELKKKDGLAEGWQTRLPRRMAPTGAILTPEQVARHAVYWLSEASSPVTGAVCEIEQYSFIGRIGSYET